MTAAAGAAAMAAVLGAGLAPAQAATSPGWQITRKVGPSTGETSPVGLVAPGRHDAWSLWETCTEGCGRAGTARLLHWNGTTWTRHGPAALGKLRAPAALGASSASDVWVFGGQYGAVDKRTTDLHWNGHTWRKITAPRWVISRDDDGFQPASAQVFGPRDVWVFSLILAGGEGRDPDLAARYNGHRWVKVHLPAGPVEVSAVSRTDIWAIGVANKTGRSELMHWNGKHWSIRRIPDPPSGKLARPISLVATGPHSTWMLAGSAAAPDKGYLLHWNGTTWRWNKMPAAAGDISTMAPDVRGGWWGASSPPTEASAEGVFWHDSNGHWTSHPVPPAQTGPCLEFWGLTHIPRTTSVMATSQLCVNGDGVGAIWQYRR
jgi:hypothetical protein